MRSLSSSTSTPRAQRFDLRAALRRRVRIGGDVPDDVLAGLHAADVVVERDVLLRIVAMGRSEAQQPGDALAVRAVLGHAFLEDVAERIGELLVLRRLVLRDLLEQVERALDACAADLRDEAVLLQDLAAHVERQVVRIDHAAHEAQVCRQQLFARVHDEHATDVQLEAVALVATAEHGVERLLLRHVQQRGVALRTLDAVVRPRERVVEVVRERLVEGLVLLVLDLALRPRPQRGGMVDRLELAGRLAVLLDRQPDRERDMVGIALDQLAQAPAVEEFAFVVLEVQGHGRAAARLVDGFERVVAASARFPAHAFARGRARLARDEGDAVGDDERGIEADAELADQLRVLAGVTRQRFEETTRARARDRADVLDHLVAAHADAVVADGQRARVLVPGHLDAKLGIVGGQRGIRQRGEAQLVARIRRIRDEFAQEDLLVRVERVRDEMQDLRDLGLEGPGFDGVGHGNSLRRSG